MKNAGVKLWGCLLVLLVLGWSASGGGQEKSVNKIELSRRLPIPAGADQAKAERLVQEIFQQDLAAAQDAAARAKLAGLLAQQGRDLRDEPTYRFVLLKQAANLAADAGDPNLALAMVDDLARAYQVAPFDEKAATLKRLSLANKSVIFQETLVDLILPLWTEAVEADQYVAAKALAQIADSAASAAKNVAMLTEVRKKRLELAEVEKGFLSLQAFRTRLEKNPEDAEANLKLGMYHGFLKRQWVKALPFLAKSKHETLAKLATSDLANPKAGADQLALADAWWDYAARSQDSGQLAAQQRASFWYEKAVGQLSGLHRTKALKRMEKTAEALVGVSTTLSASTPIGVPIKFEGHTEEVKAVAISSDGRYGASAGVDQTVRIWDLVTNKEDKVLRGHSKQVWSLVFLPGQRQLISASWDASARLWDTKEGVELRRFPHRLDLNGVAISRDGANFLTASDDHNVYLWNTSNGEEIRRFAGHTNFVYSVAFAPNGLHFASGGVDKTVRIFEISSGQALRVMEGQSNTVSQVLYSPDGRFVLSAGDAAVHVWDAATGKEVRKFEGHRGNVPAIALTQDGRRLITGGDDRTIRVWDFLAGKEIAKLEGHTDTVTCLAVSTDGRRLISGSIDRSVRVWSIPAR